jgi:hypothetical protein
VVFVSGAARESAAARSGILPAAVAINPDPGVPTRRAADVAGFLAPPCPGLSRVRGLEACFIPAVSSKAGMNLLTRRLAGVSRPARIGAPGRVPTHSAAGAMTAPPGRLRLQRRADGTRPAPVMPGNRKGGVPNARHLGMSAGD